MIVRIVLFTALQFICLMAYSDTCAGHTHLSAHNLVLPMKGHEAVQGKLFDPLSTGFAPGGGRRTHFTDFCRAFGLIVAAHVYGPFLLSSNINPL